MVKEAAVSVEVSVESQAAFAIDWVTSRLYWTHESLCGLLPLLTVLIFRIISCIWPIFDLMSFIILIYLLIYQYFNVVQFTKEINTSVKWWFISLAANNKNKRINKINIILRRYICSIVILRCIQIHVDVFWRQNPIKTRTNVEV